MISHAKEVTKSEHIFFVRSTSHLENVNVLLHLVASNKSVVVPLLRTYATMRYGRKILRDDSKWNRNIDMHVSFLKASTGAGNTSGIPEKFLSGVNFVTTEKGSKFWKPLIDDYDLQNDRMIE